MGVIAETRSEDATRVAAAMPTYDVERELGRGGMGVVYLGRHRQLDRPVAIKELPPSFAGEAEVRARFSTEARTLATLSHPHIVPIFDYVERDGLCLIVMQQLPGGTVWDRFTTDGLVAPTACAVVMACCAALQHAHDRGVLHLDVKPDNLMFETEEAVKVTDFGIARVISGDRTLGTADGQVLGTPAYMSPEQARGDDLTAASDVYSAGVMLYELLSGHLPWQGAQTAGELLNQRLTQDPIPLRDLAPHVPEPLAAVVMKAIQRDEDARHRRAEDFGVAIGEACARSWGPDWTEHAGVAVMGLDVARPTHSAPAEHQPIVGTTPAASTTALGVTAAPAPKARETMGPGSAAPAAPAEEEVDLREPPAFEVVRARISRPHIQGADIFGLEMADLIGVEDILDPPRRPWRPLAATALLLTAAIGVALFGVGTPSRDRTLDPGQVTINGADVARQGRLSLDLSQDLTVEVVDAALARTVDEVTLEFGLFGATVTDATAPLRNGRATVDPGLAQRAMGGSASAAVTLRGQDRAQLRHELGIHATHAWFLALPGLMGILLLLVAFANLESTLKPLAAGRMRKLSFLGAAISGAATGLGLVALSAALGQAEPTLTATAAATITATVAGFALARARLRDARRQRVRRAVKRAERSLGVRVTH